MRTHDDDNHLWQVYTQDVRPLNKKSLASPPRNIPSHRTHRPITQVIDIHGLSIAEAYAAWLDFVTANHSLGYSSVTVITGHGVIRSELPHWVASDPLIRNLEELKGGGAFRLRFRRQRR